MTTRVAPGPKIPTLQEMTAEPVLTTRQQTVMWAGILALITITAYLPTLRNGFIWEDDDYVTNNLTLRSVKGLARLWLRPRDTPQYYPVVHTTFWIEYRLWQLSPVGFHTINMFLHASTAILLWQVLKRLNVPGAWVAAAVFAVHPVNVESVGWVTQRKNVLSCAFLLAAMLAYFRYSPPEELARPKKLSSEQRNERWKWYAIAFGLFLLALFSKTVTCSLPAVLVIVFWWKRGRVGWRDVLPLMPFFVVGACAGLLTAYLEKVHVGAEGLEWDLTLPQRFTVAGHALVFYVKKLFFPYPLMFIYPRWNPDAHVLKEWLYLAAVVVVILALFLLRHRITRGPVAAVLLFVGMIFPALSFFDVYPMRFSFVADHFQYHASMPITALVVALITVGLSKYRDTGKYIGIGLLTVVLTTYVLLVWWRLKAYENNRTIWTDTITKNPACWVAYNNLAKLKVEEGDVGGAIENYRSALKLFPNYAMAHTNLGALLYREGYANEALAHTRRALELMPEFSQAYLNLGKMLVKTGHPEEGFAHLKKAVELQPGYALAHLEWGDLLAERGDFAGAIAQYDAALKIHPEYVEAHNNLGEVYNRLGRHGQADDEFRRALQIDPDFGRARRNLQGINF
jgi:Tfp pilus assembly protein PilF